MYMGVSISTMMLILLTLIAFVAQLHGFNYETVIKRAQRFYHTLPRTILEDATLLVPDLVKKYGYPCESHAVRSADGYHLTMHRIPHGFNGGLQKNRPAVYVQHGLLSSSADWLLAGPDRSLGYLLADAGFDVWLPNVRGNRYSREHETLDPDSEEFWNFSWNEIALDDVPTMIDYVLEKTEQRKLFYIGHSQGTTVFYVLCSERPQYNDKIELHISLSPIGYVNQLGSPLLQMIASFDFGPEVIDPMEFLPTTKFLAVIGQKLCSNGHVTQVLCTNALFAVAGFNKKQMNETLLPVIMGHTPAGASTKQVLHYIQEMQSGEFQKWDYGFFGNIILYRSLNPPDYIVEKITAPMCLYYSINDWLSHEIDVHRLHRRLPNVKQKILLKDYNHLDYLYAINAREVLYDQLIQTMKEHK